MNLREIDREIAGLRGYPWYPVFPNEIKTVRCIHGNIFGSPNPLENTHSLGSFVPKDCTPICLNYPIISISDNIIIYDSDSS
jgi:hypothetical protein